MKTIALITLFTPTKENYRGSTALLYYMLRDRASDIQVKVYSLDLTDVPEDMWKSSEKELNCEIINVKKKSFFTKLNYYRRRLLALIHNLPSWSFLKISEKYVTEIKALNPDLIWIFPYQISGVSLQFKDMPQVITCSDSTALHYYRKLRDINYARDKQTYKSFQRFLNLESLYSNRNLMLHMVGVEDAKFLQQSLSLDKERIFFIEHPHYSYIKKTSYFTTDKLKVLIAGQYNEYVKTDFDKLQMLLLQNKDLTSEITLTFLGKDWENFSNQLQQFGYESNTITWVEEYFAELVNYDIQLFPISLGTGTKGKVLDALCCGLICIGSEYAFENIGIQTMESCLQYDDIEDIAGFMKDIKNRKDFYVQLAQNGHTFALEKHSPKLISSLFFQKIFDDSSFSSQM